MANRPMGFGPSGPDDEGGDPQDPSDPQDPMAALFAAAGDPEQLAQALRAAGAGDVDAKQVREMIGQVQRMLATPGDGGPVNWDVANDVARQVVSQHGDPSVTTGQVRAVQDALRLADTWLDGATELPAAGATAAAWSAAEWVEGTRAVWRRLVEPVAESVTGALGDALAKQLPEGGLSALPPGLPGLPAGAGGADAVQAMMRQIGGSVFGLQLGQAVGTLATEVVGGTEIGLPLVQGAVVLLPSAVAAFGEGLDVPADEVRLYLALREAARARLFAHVPWLGPQLLGAVEGYARGISIDTEAIESAVRDVDPTDAESMQRALSSGMFEPELSPAQTAALERLETDLALLEGWVEVVVDAASGALPHASALRETVRRRRATGGPAEQTFAALVGLELRPRRLRDAAAVWTVIGEAMGPAGRDGLWAHPDLLPGAADLDDPLGFTERRAQAHADDAELDADLARLLDGESGGPAGPAA